MANGAGQAPTNQESTASMLQAYQNYLPGVIAASNTQQTPTALAQLGAQQAAQPGYDALNLSEAQQYGLPMAQVGQQIANSNALAGAQTNVNLLQGAGGDAARAAYALQQQTNPDYYKNLGLATQGNTNLMNSISLNGLSPGEAAAVERSTNQGQTGTGNLGLNNNTNALSNAMNFGGAFNSKLGILQGVIGSANNTANTAAGNAGFSATPIALGTGQSNQGTTFQNPGMSTTASPTTPNQLSNTYLSSLGGLANTQLEQQQKVAYANSLQGTAGSFGGGNGLSGGNGCCFIFLEATNGILPWYVRYERDKYYAKEPALAIGYVKMANWLVPMMKKNRVIKWIVNYSMVKPLTHVGGYDHKVNSYGWILRPVKSFWFMIWRNT